VSDTIPAYLRIHRGPDSAVPSPAEVCPLDDLWSHFTAATGWRVDQRSHLGDRDFQLLPSVTDNLEPVEDAVVGSAAARRLAQSLSAVTAELQCLRDQVRQQHAELAARAALVGGSEQQGQLADRLQTTLAAAAAACRCDSAALYLLDDDTEFLTTRAVDGLPRERLHQPPRTLRGSRGDLEAMVQGVVAIDALTELTIDTWNCPEQANVAAAICAVVSSDDVPIGTLWLFARDEQTFGPSAEAAARLAAEQLGLLLHGATTAGQIAHRESSPLRDLVQWQYDALPIGEPLAKDWNVDGMIDSPQPWATGWHLWDVLPDGSLMVAIAEACDRSLRGALDAAMGRAALTAHAGYRHSPSQLMQRVNDSLWQSSTTGQKVSLLYLRLDPETGEGEYAAAGSIAAMIASARGHRPLVAGGTAPLCSDFRAAYLSDSFRLQPGETLLAYSPGFTAAGVNQTMLGEIVRDALVRRDQSPLAAVRRALASLPREREFGAMALTRSS